LTDDQGYGDVGCFGATDIATPNLDRLATEGVRFTDFHVSSAVCSASRASLLTGCYHGRLGIHTALGPKSSHGLHPDETTLADLLKQRGYATGMAGKWHLGHRPEFLPNAQGFDEFFGLPYSNDMWPHHPTAAPGTYPPLPLLEDGKIIDPEIKASEQRDLTVRYTARAVDFITRHRDRPFFFYLAHAMPHVPLAVSERFTGRSARGLYGDAIMEIDWSVGEILQALSRHGLDEDTLVIFTSDNGPWRAYGDHAGSAGALREGKHTSWEGGTRVPFIARWTGRIPAASAQPEPVMTIDLLPTIAHLVGAELPRNKIDGEDIWPLFIGRPSPGRGQKAYFTWYGENQLQAVRSGPWKLILPHHYNSLAGTEPARGGRPVAGVRTTVAEPQLYHLPSDISEFHDLAGEHPEHVQRLLALAGC
jgi:arylsulfatase